MDKRPLPVPLQQLIMEIQTLIDSLKIQLEEQQTLYCHALVTGDWEACLVHRNRVISIRNAVGRLVKQKLSAKS